MMKVKKKCKLKTIVLSVLGALLAIVIIAGIVFFWNYPGYATSRKAVDAGAEVSDEITLMSYNLRCLSPLDLGKKSWYYRANLVIEDIENYAPGIIGFQEATQWQYSYLTKSLVQYDSVITYRDESIIAEGCPIFYRTDYYTLVEKGSFWLSETPDVMSKDWGAAHYRICSYVILCEKASGKEFVVFNTHLDHVSDEARIKGIEVVLGKIEAFGSLPAVIMGDLNAEEGSETYQSVTEHFLDARYEAPITTDSYTYQNWGNFENSRRIDYFMVSKTGIDVLRYAVLTETHNGIWSSDHCPLILNMKLQ